MTKTEEQQIVDLLARQEKTGKDLQGLDSDYSRGFQAGWEAAISAVRAYLKGAGMIPNEPN